MAATSGYIKPLEAVPKSTAVEWVELDDQHWRIDGAIPKPLSIGVSEADRGRSASLFVRRWTNQDNIVAGRSILSGVCPRIYPSPVCAPGAGLSIDLPGA